MRVPAATEARRRRSSRDSAVNRYSASRALKQENKRKYELILEWEESKLREEDHLPACLLQEGTSSSARNDTVTHAVSATTVLCRTSDYTATNVRKPFRQRPQGGGRGTKCTREKRYVRVYRMYINTKDK